jgi:kynurenine 3-monooxygenase
MSSPSYSRENNKSVRICIVGAGLAGSMMAILLAKLGYRISVYEKREDPRVVC